MGAGFLLLIEDMHLKNDLTIQRTVLFPRISDASEADMICEIPVEVNVDNRGVLVDEDFILVYVYKLKDGNSFRYFNSPVQLGYIELCIIANPSNPYTNQSCAGSNFLPVVKLVSSNKDK